MDFEKYVEEVKSKLSLKDDLEVNDIVVLCLQDMIIFGKVTEITRDTAPRKDTWWCVNVTLFLVPLVTATFILRDSQMCGNEIFTIDGKQHYMTPINLESKPKQPPAKKKSFLKRIK